MNVQKKDQTKPSYFLKVRKPIVKATSSEPIVVVRAFVKTAHYESNTGEKQPNIKR